MCAKKFDDCTTLTNAITLLKKSSVQHRVYCHYTTLENLRLMMASKTFWLRRCNSKEFDDRIEQIKFGKKEEQQKFYLSCFSFEEQELASMWGLYCPPTYQAIRLTMKKADVGLWVKSVKSAYRTDGGMVNRGSEVSIKSHGFNDIVYASVRENDMNENRDGTLYWNGKTTKPIDGIAAKKSWKSATGLVKDIDWKFESESRMWLKTRDDLGLEQVAVNLPVDVIENMEFTLSPWLKDYEEDFVRSLIRKWVGGACGNKGDNIKFFNSSLRGGLQKWAARRGV